MNNDIHSHYQYAKEHLSNIYGLAVSGEIKSHAVYVDTDSVIVSKTRLFVCMIMQIFIKGGLNAKLIK